MRIRGAIIIALKQYVLDNFGKEGVEKWIESLEPDSRNIFLSTIRPRAWYPFIDGSLEPENKICELFHDGDIKKSWLVGRYVADEGLKGIYRFFVKHGNPNFIIKKAGFVMNSFFDDAKIEVLEFGPKSVAVRLVEFEGIDEMLEWHIGGWIERAFEIVGCENIKIDIVKSLARGDDVTGYMVSWN